MCKCVLNYNDGNKLVTTMAYNDDYRDETAVIRY